MKEVDISSWKRREHFNFFRNVAYPIYNICFDVDVTALKEFSNREGISFNLSMIFITTAALNDIENFRYRLRGDKVVLHDSLTPSFTYLEEGDDLFKMVTVEMGDDLKGFVERAGKKAGEQKGYFIADNFIDRDDFVFYSTLPWITFTSIDHTTNLKREDAIQRVSWGRYCQRDGRLIMPFNIQVNHMFVDGVHLGMFKETLDRRLAAPM